MCVTRVYSDLTLVPLLDGRPPLLVASKLLRLLDSRVVDSTTLVNFLSPQMSELVEDDIAS